MLREGSIFTESQVLVNYYMTEMETEAVDHIVIMVTTSVKNSHLWSNYHNFVTCF